MKSLKLKKFIATLIVILMLFVTYFSAFSWVHAVPARTDVPADMYKFNAQDILVYSDERGTGHDVEYPAKPVAVTDEDLSSKKIIKVIGGANSVNDAGASKFDATDSSLMVSATYMTGADMFEIIKTMVDTLKISENDLKVTYLVEMPNVNGVTGGKFSYTVSGYENPKINLTEDEKDSYKKTMFNYMIKLYPSMLKKDLREDLRNDMTDEEYEQYWEREYGNYTDEDWKMYIVEDWKEKIIGIVGRDKFDEKYGNYTDEELTIAALTGSHLDFSYLSIKAEINGDSEYSGAVYQLVASNDETWYMKRTTEPTPVPVPIAVAEFKTTLDYTSTPQGKMNDKKDTYLPPYYENEDKNAKKDVDATAIIKSKTKEEIVATNGVKLTDENIKGNPNSEGWYYPDLKDKTVIEKVYPFDTSNNQKENGAVKETVKLTGKNGGEDSQTPSVAWTLRRINYDEKTNDDKSVTVTITYNLPIDEKSIPEGWKGIADPDGGIRRITRTFKVGEDYDKDVTVEQNGPSTATVTTPVKVRWNIATKIIPQTGESWAKVIAGAIALMAIALISYRKFKK